MKYLAVAVVALVIGYFLHPVFNPPPKDKFETFVKTEAAKFAEATDADAKLKAAEEMYGKMMILFLAELGLRVSEVPVSKPVAEKPEKECPPQIITETKKEMPVMTGSPDALSDKPNQKVEMKPDTPESRWTKYATTPFLESFKGKDRRMLGKFEGILKRNNGREDTVEMNFNLIQNGKNIEGETLVVMTDPNGKVYSRDAGNGGNRSIKSAEGDGYYIEASPTSYFLVNLKHYPQLSGKYFEKGKLIGEVHLRKISP